MKLFETLGTIVGAMLVILVLVGGAMIGGTIETHYNRDGIVDNIENGEITIIDKGGDIWIYTPNKITFEIGDKVTMKMYNSCTEDNIYDDEILKVVKR